ncbi:MAG: T9SS type A sorting domain-containing protein [Cyclobacteriaceae bacterium]
MDKRVLLTSLISLVTVADSYSLSCGPGTAVATYQGNLKSIVFVDGVFNSEEALGEPDYTLLNPLQAEFSLHDNAIYDLEQYVPAGNVIEVRLIIGVGNRMQRSSSTDNLTYSDETAFTNDLAVVPGLTSFDYTVPEGGIRYLRFRSSAGTILLDGVIYDFSVCLPDADDDSVADKYDKDDDNDGLADLQECACTSDPSGDDDMDGIPAYLDTDTPGFADNNNDSTNDNMDHDGDGVPNHLDLDTDNDAMPDALEANSGSMPQNYTSEGRITTTYLALNDTDADGMADTLPDGPLAVPDTDGDGLADHMDMDTDNNGLTDAREAGADDADGDGFVDAFTDVDSDGLADAHDPDYGGSLIAVMDSDDDDIPDYLDDDSDADGVPDMVEIHDSNLDGIADWDLNNNRLADLAEGGTDTNRNGLADRFDTWAGAAAVVLQDSDGDGIPDYRDPDDDNDGIATIDEDVNDNGVYYDDFTAGQSGEFAIRPDYLYDNFLTLPVTLISFTSEVAANKVKLSWVTASEENNSHFEVQRADASLTFEKIGTIQGIGTTETKQFYHFDDHLPAYGQSFYRLKQVDNNGTCEYSEVIRVDVKASAPTILMSIYPNPSGANKDVTIDLQDLNAAEQVEIAITDLFGQVVYQDTYNPASQRKVLIQYNRLSITGGVYIVSATSGGHTLTERLYIN